MKIVALLSFIIGIIFANDLVINKSFIINGKFQAKYLFTEININSSSLLRSRGELNNEIRRNITSSLNNVINEAKKGNICKGGGYSINPIISYDSNKNKTTSGQNIDFSLECKFLSKDLSAYNSLLANINKIVSSNKFLNLSQPKLNHKITNEEINLFKEELFETFLSDLDKVEDKYSKLLNKKCIINEINTMDNNFAPMPIYKATNKSMALIADSTISVEPIASDSNISIDINVGLICK